ncbi:MAG: nucleoside 2-deoxyribosyltransferase domain-containing protein [Nanoarchaeota archaeon]|nr:nucleoside 2-deoxyribosyltransferase domain-containing protein [Nanoarchaeota archaeon]
MKLVRCPEIYEGNKKSLFLAGGISNCPDWQKELINLLRETDLVLLDPRREKFERNNKEMEEEQIKWEFEHLNKSESFSFWFPKETVCPITLYELGKESASNKRIFVGVHPEYSRRRDVEIQTKLIRPEVKIVYSLGELAKEIKKGL